MIKTRSRFGVGDVVAHKGYPQKCGRITRIARANPRSPDRGAVIYTVKWSDHISGESKHLEDALKAVIRKL